MQLPTYLCLSIFKAALRPSFFHKIGQRAEAKKKAQPKPRF